MQIFGSIDSVLIMNQYRKRFITTSSDTIIEGIGNLNDALTPFFSWDGYSSYLLCFKQNDTLLYMNSLFNTCDTNTQSPLNVYEVNIKRKNEVKIYPNPAQRSFTITGNFDTPALFELYDITGRKILSQVLTNNDKIVSVSHLSKSIYIYRINTVDGKITRGKLVIE